MKCYWGNLGVEQNQEICYKNVEQIQEVHVEQNQVDMSNKVRFPSRNPYTVFDFKSTGMLLEFCTHAGSFRDRRVDSKKGEKP